VESELLENGASDVVTALGGLVGIGGGPNADAFTGANFLKFLVEQPCGLLFDIDFLLEGEGIAQLHKFVGVARVTVFAGEFASTVGVDGPLEGVAANRCHAAEERTRGESEVLNVMTFPERIGMSGEPGNADERGGS